MTDKVKNYTDEQVAVLIAGYDPEADEATRKAQIAALSDEVGKSAASVRACASCYFTLPSQLFDCDRAVSFASRV